MRKKHFIYLILLLFPILTVCCGEGYTSSKEAKVLLDYLKPEKLKELTENPNEQIIIIDVRPAQAYKNGHIPTAKSFPSSEILKRLDEIPKDKFLILYCETGGRAQAVIRQLEKKGYTLMMNWGGYKRWKWEYIKGE